MKLNEKLDKQSNLERLKAESIEKLRKRLSSLSNSVISLGTIVTQNTEPSKMAKKKSLSMRVKEQVE